MNAFAQQDERIRIEFIADQDSFPDCRTLFYANGNYTVSNKKLPEIDIPNTIPVNPTELSWDSSMAFHSFSSEAKKLGSLDFDEVQVIPYSYDEVRELIHASKDSAQCYRLINDEDYLRTTFGIVHDVNLAPIQKRTLLYSKI